MRNALFALLFVSCNLPGGQDEIFATSNCGIRYRGVWTTKPDGNDERITANVISSIEFRTLTELTASSDPRFADYDTMCKKLKGFDMWTHRESAWYSKQNQIWVAGETACWYGIFEVGSRTEETGIEHPINMRAAAHELAHVVQGCDSTPPVDRYSNIQHANWVRDGIFDAIGAAGTRLLEMEERGELP